MLNVLIYSNMYWTLKQRAIPFYVHLWYASLDMSSWFVSDNICILPYSHLQCSRIRKTIDKIWFKKILKNIIYVHKRHFYYLTERIKTSKTVFEWKQMILSFAPFFGIAPFLT